MNPTREKFIRHIFQTIDELQKKQATVYKSRSCDS